MKYLFNQAIIVFDSLDNLNNKKCTTKKIFI